MKRILKPYLTHAHALTSHRSLSWFGNFLKHPALWHLNRHGVSRGFAIGLFCGLIPGPFQMIGAGLACFVFKANLPLALLTTLYTNPVTIIPLYWLAYAIGSKILQSGHFIKPPEIDWSRLGMSLQELWLWAQGLGKPLLLGIVILAVALAILGYTLTHLLWRLHTLHAWRQRRVRRLA